MPELKHTFTSGRMNKDLDERLVPNGEYRDAQNIEVLTSEGSDVGTVQTCLGNSIISDLVPDNDSSCVGSVVDDKTNSVYYFIAGNSPTEMPRGMAVQINQDLIVEYNSANNTTLPVIVDIYNVHTAITNIVGFTHTVLSTDGLRIGMEVDTQPTSIVGPLPIITAIPTSTTVILSSSIAIGSVNFIAPRVLNFDKDRLITGVNVIDDMLFWTDNFSEPKKVNITRGKQGSIPSPFNQNPANGTTHTHLVVDGETIKNYSTNGITLNPNPLSTTAAPLPPFGIEEYLQEKHITVIKKSPLTPPKLEMYDKINRFNPVATTGYFDWWGSLDGGATIALYPIGTTSVDANSASNGGTMAIFDTTVDFRVDDVLLLTDDAAAAIDANGNPLPFPHEKVKIRLQVISSNSTNSNPTLVQSPSNGNLHVRILDINSNIAQGGNTWYVRLEDNTEPLYELKFPKFGYRYKYEDGEYSAFSPFSETAFLSQKFDYHPKKGYNKGMTNGLKQLFIKDFIPPNIPLDVIEIDILYKESDSPNIYTIRSFKDTDPEWNIDSTGSYKGRFEITDDLIHAVVASNQLLRPWDNVPRKALGQEVTGNRIIYGNYLQNYDLKAVGDVSQYLKPEFKTTIESSAIDEVGIPETSLKSMRTYQLGIAYKDIYGRETPVMTHPSGVAKLNVGKAILNNKFTVQTTTPPPFWADSFKYFVKEVSNEYYNLAMDRWYNAEEGQGADLPNIWLSFPSEDRNKVDDETTLILKKALTDKTVSGSSFVSESPRRKVLAIENEAPDYIKTSWAPMGTWNNGNAAQDIGNFGTAAYDGFPYEDRAYIRITKEEFEKSDFASLQNDKNTILNGGIFDANTALMIRFSDANSSSATSVRISSWYNISNISFNNTGSSTNLAGHYTINIDGSFGNDVDFLALGGTQTNIIANVHVEIAKKTIENKPEFDGKFFVKVEYDGLEQHLSSATKSTAYQNWVVNSNGGTIPVYWMAGGGDTNTSLLACATTYNPNSLLTEPQSMSGFTGSYNANTGTLGPFTDPPREVYYSPPALPEPGGSGSSLHYPYRTSTQWDDWFSINNVGPTGTPLGGTNATHDPYEGWFIDSEPALDRYSMAYGFWGSYYIMAEPGLGADIGQSTINISKVYVDNPSHNTLVDNFLTQEDKDIAEKLNTVGTRFRFASDPEKIVYEIGSTSWDYLWNYDESDVHDTHAKRIRFTIDLIEPFSRTVNNLIGDAKKIGETSPGVQISLSAFAPCDYFQVDPTFNNSSSNSNASESNTTVIEFVEPTVQHQKQDMPTNPAVWETEPKEDVGLDIYYEIGQAYPVNMKDGTEELYIQVGAAFNSILNSNTGVSTNFAIPPIVIGVTGGACDPYPNSDSPPATGVMFNTPMFVTAGDTVSFTNPDGTIVTATVSQDTPPGLPLGSYGICVSSLTHGEKHTLAYYNCYTYGNGVESNRIRDLFNAVTIDKGVKASTTLAEQYKEEERKSGLIFSGIYNSMNGVNRLNQFIMAEDITKDLNPEYGSIQKLHSRDDDLITLCEDKIIKVLANKDALYNADDTKNITASRNVLGYADPFVGEYGISKNPESFASESFRAYFTDKERGAVMRLSRDGLTPISEHGMKDWFADNLSTANKLIGSYDSRKSLYNITLKQE